MQISKEIQFDYGHCVTYHESQCQNLHGHRAKVVIVVEGNLITEDRNPEMGMVMDFGKIKKLAMTHVHDVLDHAFIIWEHDPRAKTIQSISNKVVVMPFVPTAEQLAKWVFDQLADKISNEFSTGLKLTEIHFYETPTSCARYAPH